MNFTPKAAQFNDFQRKSTKNDEFPAEGGTKRHQFELAISQHFEVEIGQPGGRWKAESQGFPTTTPRAPGDITSSSYDRFEIVPPPADGRTPPTLYRP